MKKLLVFTAHGLLLALCLTWISCNEEERLVPANTQDTTLDWRSNNPSVSGHVEIDIPWLDVLEKYSFTAVMQKDGSVTGEFQIFDKYGDGSKWMAHGYVDCFYIDSDGKTAYLHGVVDAGEFNGAQADWKVVDNGEGKNNSPDVATDLSVFQFMPPWFSSWVCSGNNFNFAEGPLVRGNVQVHP